VFCRNVCVYRLRFAVLAAGAAGVLGAAPPPPLQAGPPAVPGPCAAPEYRQFDFWLGEWEVRTPAGKLAGRNTITRMLGGCVLQERWRGARGHQGTSYNIYDASRRRWHQTWVDDEGLLLQLEGGYADGRMVLSGEIVDSAGRPVKQRITWERMDGGRVRQRWDSSSDGVTWETQFEGIYNPVKR
jgi:hypothetical protein